MAIILPNATATNVIESYNLKDHYGETIEIVVKMPKEAFERIYDVDHLVVKEFVKNGTVLPKNHGNLIDKESLIKAIEQKAKRLKNLDTINGLCGAVALAYEAETVIEADKEAENAHY